MVPVGNPKSDSKAEKAAVLQITSRFFAVKAEDWT
jgi:hypothetical protein